MYRFVYWESVFTGETWPDLDITLDSTDRKVLLSVLSYVAMGDVWLKGNGAYKLSDSEQAMVDDLVSRLT